VIKSVGLVLAIAVLAIAIGVVTGRSQERGSEPPISY
jgi:hypothetical protein